MKYNRVLLKLSGESLAAEGSHGYSHARLSYYAEEIADVVSRGLQLGIVIGGGNIFRGLPGSKGGIGRVTGDHMGMLATVMNGIALQDALAAKNTGSKILSAFPAGPFTEVMSVKRAGEYLEACQVVIFTGGTGNPFFTTDSAAALRAAEINAEILIKGTRVDGVYTADPEKDSGAVKYDRLTFTEAYDKGLRIMDLTAFTLCRENNISLMVIDINTPGNLLRAVSGQNPGTLVSNG
ncbi:MAG: UMP kinase [Bacteroidales bacterium]|nr:UMP kinase [Bacteroidales bacterium]